MYNVLLVDDEEIALAAMKKGVHWENLLVTGIHMATNITDAKAILTQRAVDVLICDIEMPNGSGIDLVRWMNERQMEVVCIFLTCHSDFDYARTAITLGISEYLLKPVDHEELELVLEKAIEKKKYTASVDRARMILADVSRENMVPEDEARKNQQILEETKAFIQKNISMDISRDDVAANVFLNPDYLSRIFKKETGYSISEYILKMRMSVACELLVKTDLSVSKVAASCGYTHMAHFSKMFKKEMLLTPNEYRMKYRLNEKSSKR